MRATSLQSVVTLQQQRF